MPVSIAETLGHQLRSPSGCSGRVAGALMRVLNEECNRLAVDALQIEAGNTVLEAGCGPGHALALLAARASGALIHGFDRSQLMISQARARNRTAVRAGRVMLYRASFANLPMRTRSVDAVLAVNVAYFWTDAHRIVQEIRRVLRPGGRLVVYVTDRASMRNWPFASAATHVHSDANTLQTTLRCAGFGAPAIEVRRLRLRGRVQGLLAVARMS